MRVFGFATLLFPSINCMASAPNAMDVGTGAFSPDGSLYQLEYACAAADRGSLAIGVEAAGAVVLVCARGSGGSLGRLSSEEALPLDLLRCRDSPANRKLVAISPTIGCAVGGLLPDSRVLVNSARNMVPTTLHFDPCSHRISPLHTTFTVAHLMMCMRHL
jgi:20S proteasome alpha/beta subunit